MLALGLFREHWELYHKVTFDPINRLIIVNPGVAKISIQSDVYSAWKRWHHIVENSRFIQAMRGIGGDPTVDGKLAGDIYFLINGWKFLVDISETAVTGVLFSDDYISAYYTKEEVQQFPPFVSNLVQTVETAGESALTIEQQVLLGNALTKTEYLAFQK